MGRKKNGLEYSGLFFCIHFDACHFSETIMLYCDLPNETTLKCVIFIPEFGASYQLDFVWNISNSDANFSLIFFGIHQLGIIMKIIFQLINSRK